MTRRGHYWEEAAAEGAGAGAEASSGTGHWMEVLTCCSQSLTQTQQQPVLQPQG